MTTKLPLDTMSTLDKLRALEEIWNDLLQNSEEVPVPKWHNNVLTDREKLITDGTATFKEWSETKDSIRHRIQ